MAATKAKAAGERKLIRSPPHFRLPQLLQQELLESSIGSRGEKVDAAGLAILAQALAEVLHRLLIRFQPVAAERDFLDRACLRVHQPEVAIRSGVQFIGGKNLDYVH